MPSSTCKWCLKAENSHSACVRHAPCWKHKLYYPERCQSCIENFEKADSQTWSKERDEYRDNFQKWIHCLIILRQKLDASICSNAHSIWSSKKSRENFTRFWCQNLKDLPVGEPIYSSSEKDKCEGSRTKKPSNDGDSTSEYDGKRVEQSEILEEEVFNAPDIFLSDIATSSRSGTNSKAASVDEQARSTENDQLQQSSDDQVGAKLDGLTSLLKQFLENQTIQNRETRSDTRPIIHQEYEDHNPWRYGDDTNPPSFSHDPEYDHEDQQLFRTDSAVPSQPASMYSRASPPAGMHFSSENSEYRNPVPRQEIDDSDTEEESPETTEEDRRQDPENIWFLPHPNAMIDMEKKTLSFEGSLFNNEDLVIKIKNDKKVFRPISWSKPFMAVLVNSSRLLSEPKKVLVNKLSMYELVAAPIKSKRVSPESGWKDSESLNTLLCNLSDQTKSALCLDDKKYVKPHSKELVLNLKGSSDSASIKFFDVMQAPKLSSKASFVGGPLEKRTKSISEAWATEDSALRSKLLNVTSAKTIFEMGFSLASPDSLKDLELNSKAHIHISFLRKALEAGIRLLDPIIASNADDFIRSRKRMMESVTSPILTESVACGLQDGDPYCTELWSQDCKTKAIDLARVARIDQTLKFTEPSKSTSNFRHGKSLKQSEEKAGPSTQKMPFQDKRNFSNSEGYNNAQRYSNPRAYQSRPNVTGPRFPGPFQTRGQNPRRFGDRSAQFAAPRQFRPNQNSSSNSQFRQHGPAGRGNGRYAPYNKQADKRPYDKQSKQ